MKKYYIAYGSNLNMNQMKDRCPKAKAVGTGEIKDYELLYKGSKTGAYLTIEKAEGGTVPVGIWAVGKEDESNLDRYEGYPNFYYKKKMKIFCKELDKEITAFVYIMHEERKLGVPRPSYVDTCQEGYRDFGFDTGILDDAFFKSVEGAD